MQQFSHTMHQYTDSGVQQKAHPLLSSRQTLNYMHFNGKARVVLAVFGVLCLGNAAFAAGPQKVTVSGYIRDNATGETLIGAGVVTSGGNSAKTIVGAVTNEFGFYTLTMPAGEEALTYSYVGYAEQRVDLALTRDTVINVRLVPSSELKASTIISRKDAGINSTYMGALEIPQTMIESMPVVLGEPDVIKTLQLMPGVQPGMEGFSGIYVRGGGADENMMMLDGVALYNVSHLFGLISVFTPDAVKKVTFYKGSFPARYGGRVSSVVDVRTNDGNAKGVHGSVSAGLLAEKLHLEGPLGSENTTFSISGRGMHTFLFDRVIKWAGSPANYAFYDINAKLAHRFSDRDRLFVSFYHGRDYFRYEDSDATNRRYYGDDYEPYTKYTEERSNINLKWGNMLAQARWNHVFNSKLFANTSVHWNKYDMNVTSKSSELVRSETENYSNKYKYSYLSSIMDLGARMDFDYTPAPQHLVKFGAEFISHSFRPQTQRSSESSQVDTTKTATTTTYNVSPTMHGTETSFYIEDDITLGEHFSLNPGLRLSLFTVSGKAYLRPEPRFSSKYTFGKGWALKASYSRMSQYVHQLTSGNLSLPTDLWVPITKDIKPVSSDNFSLGAYFSGLKGWEFSVEGYYRLLDNVIEYKDGKMAFASASNWEENVEVGEGRSYGVEFYVQKTVGKTTGTVAYTLSKSERIFRDGTINNGEWFPFVYDRRHNFSMTLTQKLGKRVELSALWTFMSGGWMSVPNRQTVIMSPDGESFSTIDYVESRNNYRTPPSHRLDFNLSIHKQKKRGERIWNIGMYNAYGAKNPNLISTDIRTQTDPDGTAHSVTVIDKTTFLLFLPSINYTFKF